MKILTTARKKALLFVTAFFAVMSFGLALCFSIAPTVNAGGGRF